MTKVSKMDEPKPNPVKEMKGPEPLKVWQPSNPEGALYCPVHSQRKLTFMHRDPDGAHYRCKKCMKGYLYTEEEGVREDVS